MRRVDSEDATGETPGCHRGNPGTVQKVDTFYTIKVTLKDGVKRKKRIFCKLLILNIL